MFKPKRDALAERLSAALAADLYKHGEEMLATLRRKSPTGYARLLAAVIHAQDHAPKRQPRPLRMKELLKEMDERPLDPDDPVLPPKDRERWLKGLEALQPRMPQELTEAELREAWGADLATWFTHQTRREP